MRDFVMTSASVTDGHPDKLCDRISDAIVDAYLARDPAARVHAECAIASGIVFLVAHAATATHVDLPGVVRAVVAETGYDDPDFSSKTLSILTSAAPLSMPLEPGSDHARARSSVNATVFGYACRHTPEMLPLSIVLAHRLVRGLTEARTSGRLAYLHPDGQAQVAVRYVGRQPVAIESITLSTAVKASPRRPRSLTEALMAEIVDPVAGAAGVAVSREARIAINPDPAALTGGPARHAGLTGRKTDIDSYGNYARHGGSALSGKDPSRIDRIGAYAARYGAKAVVASGLAEECELAISYAMGRPEPISVALDTFGSAKVPEVEIARALVRTIDFGVDAIAAMLRLDQRPRENGGRFFAPLAAFGHFGRLELALPWEETDRAEALARAI